MEIKARTILDVIAQRIQNGEPDRLGQPLVGRLRIVYRVNAGAIEVLIVAVSQRRNAEVYAMAERRV
jgi:mRNA interferase RelE/StbE